MILLDTCTLLWLSGDPPKIPAAVANAIRSTPAGQRYVSAISTYEIGVKHARGRLTLPRKPRPWFDATCAARGLSVLAVTKEVAQRATELPWHHRDPADRIIIATAIEAGLTVWTPDPAFRRYRGVRVRWTARRRS